MNGLDLHWTTIAKIENGDRSVRIDEAARIAANVSRPRRTPCLGRAALKRDAAGDDPVTRELARLVYTAHMSETADPLGSDVPH